MTLSLSPQILVDLLQGFPTESVFVLSLLLNIGVILFLLRCFGAIGLVAYVPIALIGCSIEVQKVMFFSFYPDPLALGATLIGSTFLCTSVLSHYYGQALAKKAIWLGFCATPIMLLFMIVAMGYRPPAAEDLFADMQWTMGVQGHIAGLFMPVPALIIGSLSAFLTSQHFNVWAFEFCKSRLGQNQVTLAALFSMVASMFLDTAIFATLSFKLLSINPVSWHSVFYTYFLPYALLKCITVMCSAPMVRVAKYCLPKDYRKVWVKES